MPRLGDASYLAVPSQSTPILPRPVYRAYSTLRRSPLKGGNSRGLLARTYTSSPTATESICPHFGAIVEANEWGSSSRGLTPRLPLLPDQTTPILRRSLATRSGGVLRRRKTRMPKQPAVVSLGTMDGRRVSDDGVVVNAQLRLSAHSELGASDTFGAGVWVVRRMLGRATGLLSGMVVGASDIVLVCGRTDSRLVALPLEYSNRHLGRWLAGIFCLRVVPPRNGRVVSAARTPRACRVPPRTRSRCQPRSSRPLLLVLPAACPRQERRPAAVVAPPPTQWAVSLGDDRRRGARTDAEQGHLGLAQPCTNSIRKNLPA
uniref:Uncharacterized protein n=1 Tax=Mycena chlorophos TaxID=658473 RepID=A0ABQ0LGX7_MYCCL|nr:predicted protein [Mycena chlorophos]